MNRPVISYAGQGYVQLLGDIYNARRNRESSYLELLSDIESLRQKRRTNCVQFLNELIPLLEAAQKVNRELDFHTAHRFNALAYLREDELGLSKIIADLLDPTGVHGQGTMFLEAMLELLSIAAEGADPKHVSTSEKLLSALASAQGFRIDTERSIDGNRRIDVMVEIQNRTGIHFCLAFENKPYAGDQNDQCEDYLKFLERTYPSNYLLVYTPPHQSMPSDTSLPNPDRWEGHFCVLPYTSVEEHSEHDDLQDESEGTVDEEGSITIQSREQSNRTVPSKFVVGDGASLTDWFASCSARSNADRIRWFLKEAERFCQQHFGKSDMTDTEARYIKEHLEKNPEQASVAYAVARAWPEYMDGECERFLTHLTERVRNKLEEQNRELTIKCEYGRKGWAQHLSIYREGWVQYEGDNTNHHSGMRTAIYLEFNVDQTDSYWGVRRAKSFNQQMPQDERTRQENLKTSLARNGLSNSNALYLHFAQTKYVSWAEIVGELAQELDKGGGEITNYYVDGLLDFVTNALDSIDAEELES